jgi:hypothetical protein
VTTAVGTRYQAAGRVQNILAWIPGRSRTGKACCSRCTTTGRGRTSGG